MTRWIAVAALLAAAQEPPKPGDTVAVRKTLEGLGKHLGTIAVKNLKVWWVVDSSASMRDDRAAIAKDLDVIFEQLPPEKKMRMGVIFYGKDAEIAQKISADVEASRKALTQSRDAGGTENVVEAVRFAQQAFGDGEMGNVVVVVTDESGDDLKGLPNLIRDLRDASTRVYVIGREAVFGDQYANEGFATPVEAGPESEALETLQTSPFCCAKGGECGDPLRTHVGFGQSVGSGFGLWALTRLAKKTGGAYFMIGGGSCKAEALEGYEPEYGVKDEGAAGEKSEIRKAVCKVLGEVVKAWDTNLETRFSGESAARAAARASGSADRKVAEWIDELRKVKKTSVGTGGVKPYRRWEAHRDLLEAQLVALSHYLEQYRLALEEGPYGDTDEGYRLESGPRRGDGKRREEALTSLKFVEEQHPGTPWAKTARTLSARLEGFAVRGIRRPPPGPMPPPGPPPGPPPPPKPPG